MDKISNLYLCNIQLLRNLCIGITTSLTLCLSGNVLAQHMNTKPDPEIQQQWIKEALTKMKSSVKLDKFKTISPSVIRLDSITRITYRVIREGWIEFGPNEWIYILLHSSHETPEIGDVILVMDDDYQYFVNYSHVCGGIVHFNCDENVKITSSDDFIRYFKEDIDLSSLKKLELK